MSEATAVVVLFAGALGDFLLALPALRLLCHRHDAARLVLGVRRPLHDVAALAGCARQVTALDDRAMAVMLGGGPAPPWWPARSHLYSWFGGEDVAIRARLEAAAERAEFLRIERGEVGAHAACAYAASIGEPRAWAELVALGALAAPDPPPRDGRAPLVVHRGAGAAAKRWHAAGFAEVAAWWRDRGGEVVELLGPAEADLEPLPVAQALRVPALPALSRVLVRASAYLGNDSGPSHLAAAVGAGGVVLFGPTDPGRWRPLSERLRPVRARLGTCAPHGFDDPPARAVIELLSERALP